MHVGSLASWRESTNVKLLSVKSAAKALFLKIGLCNSKQNLRRRICDAGNLIHFAWTSEINEKEQYELSLPFELRT